MRITNIEIESYRLPISNRITPIKNSKSANIKDAVFLDVDTSGSFSNFVISSVFLTLELYMLGSIIISQE